MVTVSEWFDYIKQMIVEDDTEQYFYEAYTKSPRVRVLGSGKEGERGRHYITQGFNRMDLEKMF